MNPCGQSKQRAIYGKKQVHNRLPAAKVNWLPISNEGLIDANRIVAIGTATSAPFRRLVQATPASHVLILTGGRKRQTVVVLDSGHVVITSLRVEQIVDLLNSHHA